MNIYKFTDDNYKEVWVVANDWTEAYSLVALHIPKMDITNATNESRDNIVLIEGTD